MDVKELLSLIENGEKSSIDFKLILDLTTARSKAELIKDVIALANSNRDGGYLLIGIADDKAIIGIQNLEEERIQQICHTYITPPVNIECTLKQMGLEHASKNIGIIFIRPTIRPHKVSKSIESIEQDMVFVRRGSTITKASPEEIISMTHEDSLLSREVNQYIKAAKIHYKVGNYENALSAICRAIEIHPDVDLFIFRAKVYVELSKSGKKADKNENLEAAIRDLGYAVKITDSEDIIAIARKMRRETSLKVRDYPMELWWEDFRYEIDKLSGAERGERIYNEVSMWDSIDYGLDEKSFSLLYEALESGYHNPELIFLIAEAHFGARNYFEALKFVKQYLTTEKLSKNNLIKSLILKGKTLVELGRFSEAREMFRQAQQVDKEIFEQNYSSSIIRSDFVEEMLYKFALENEMGYSLKYPMYKIIKILALSMGRELYQLTTSLDSKEILEWKSRLDFADQGFPGLKITLSKLLSSKDWEIIETGNPEVAIQFKLPSIEQSGKIMIENCLSHEHNGKKEYITVRLVRTEDGKFFDLGFSPSAYLDDLVA